MDFFDKQIETITLILLVTCSCGLMLGSGTFSFANKKRFRKGMHFVCLRAVKVFIHTMIFWLTVRTIKISTNKNTFVVIVSNKETEADPSDEERQSNNGKGNNSRQDFVTNGYNNKDLTL